PVNPRDVMDAEDQRVSNEIRGDLQAKLIARLREALVFDQVVDSDRETIPARSELRLRGEISRFAVGSRSLRFLVGFGAGRTKLQVEARFVDAATGLAVLAVADRRVASKGFFGGDAHDFLLDSVDEISRAVAAAVKRRAGAPL